MRIRIAFVGLAVAILGWVSVPGAAHAQLDHYKCYQGKDLKTPKFLKQTVNLKDEINGVPTGPGEDVEVLKVMYVCMPSGVDGSEIPDPTAYLTCYQIKAPTLAKPRPRVEVSTQFQKSQFELKKGKLLCVPGPISVISP